MLALVFMLLFDRVSTDIADVVMEPWFGLCEAVTPEAWQTQGNIPLGLIWLISGVLVYSMVIGLSCVGFLVIIERLRRPNN